MDRAKHILDVEQDLVICCHDGREAVVKIESLVPLVTRSDSGRGKIRGAMFHLYTY